MSLAITKHVSFPAQLFASMETRAGDFGISIAEYLRHLAINDITYRNTFQKKIDLESWENSLPEYKGSSDFWKRIDTSREEGFSDMSFEDFKNR